MYIKEKYPRFYFILTRVKLNFDIIFKIKLNDLESFGTTSLIL